MADAVPKQTRQTKALAQPPQDLQPSAERLDFELKPEQVTPDMLAAAAKAATAKATKPVKTKATPQAPAGDAQVLAYRHADRRKNNPEVGLVNASSDPEQAKTPWAYDPHLDPALQFDSARAGAE